MPYQGAALHGFERAVRFQGKLDADPIAGTGFARGENDGHDPGLADEAALGVAVEDGLHEAGLEPVDLGTWIAQAGDLDDGAVAKMEPGAGREAEEVEAARGDVLA